MKYVLESKDILNALEYWILEKCYMDGDKPEFDFVLPLDESDLVVTVIVK